MEYDFPKWYVDESNKRPGFYSLAIREEGTDQLVATLPDVPLDDEEKIAVLRDEARHISLTPELVFMLERFVYAAETRREPKYSDGSLYREMKKAAYNLIDRTKGME